MAHISGEIYAISLLIWRFFQNCTLFSFNLYTLVLNDSLKLICKPFLFLLLKLFVTPIFNIENEFWAKAVSKRNKESYGNSIKKITCCLSKFFMLRICYLHKRYLWFKQCEPVILQGKIKNLNNLKVKSFLETPQTLRKQINNTKSFSFCMKYFICYILRLWSSVIEKRSDL